MWNEDFFEFEEELPQVQYPDDYDADAFVCEPTEAELDLAADLYEARIFQQPRPKWL